MSVGVGVIGTGVMGAEHARLVAQETPGAHLAGVYDADRAKAEAAALGATVFADPHALIAACDAVIVAAPDALHAELTLACLKAGKPVLCEKPLAATAEEALRLVEAEAAFGRQLIQVGYMRRFDPGYQEMKRARESGALGATALLHNVHRNVKTPDWFTGAMSITNSFVHEIDISRWLTDSELTSAHVASTPNGDPLQITMMTDRGEIVSTEVFVNAAYGYHVHAELVGRAGTIALAPPALTLMNAKGAGGLAYPANWIPRFADAYRRQLASWVSGANAGASAWDGYAASAIAEQIAAALAGSRETKLALAARPRLYD